jgi:hypothetical protein
VLPLALSVSTGEVILIVVFAAIPVALVTFVVGAGKALDEVGKGQFAVEFESDLPQNITDDGSAAPDLRDAEIRQLLQAKAYRQRERGGPPLDVEAELTKLKAEGSAGAPSGVDPQLAQEVRQLVVARNERRARQGKEPLDVEREVERQLRELENLGQ